MAGLPRQINGLTARQWEAVRLHVAKRPKGCADTWDKAIIQLNLALKGKADWNVEYHPAIIESVIKNAPRWYLS
jgi:hypothetical protein